MITKVVEIEPDETWLDPPIIYEGPQMEEKSKEVIHHQGSGCQESKNKADAKKSWMWHEVTCKECQKNMSSGE